jgi:hypothetical protein
MLNSKLAAQYLCNCVRYLPAIHPTLRSTHAAAVPVVVCLHRRCMHPLLPRPRPISRPKIHVVRQCSPRVTHVSPPLPTAAHNNTVTGTRRRRDGGSPLSSTRSRPCPCSRPTLSPHGSTVTPRLHNPRDAPALSTPSHTAHTPSQAPLSEMVQGSSSSAPPDSNTLSTALQCFTVSRSAAATSCTPTSLSRRRRGRRR